ncbi:MAG: hypothetical protein ABMB14_26475 [Myxococcota bacterium]
MVVTVVGWFALSLTGPAGAATGPSTTGDTGTPTETPTGTTGTTTGTTSDTAAPFCIDCQSASQRVGDPGGSACATGVSPATVLGGASVAALLAGLIRRR